MPAIPDARPDNPRHGLFYDLGFEGDQRLRHFHLNAFMKGALMDQAHIALGRLIADRGINAPGLVDAALNSVGLTVPPITEAPGFDGRDNSSIGGGRV